MTQNNGSFLKTDRNKNAPTSLPTASLGDELLLFIKQIDGLSSSLVLALKVMAAVREKVAESMTDFFEQYGTLVEETDDRKCFAFENQHASKSENLKKQFAHAEQAHLILPRGFIVSLVTQFDAYLARLIRALYFAKPEFLDASGSALSFSTLLELKSIDAARELLLEREIEAILRKSPAEKFAWLETKFGVPLRKEFLTWHTLIEVTERSRHFVHKNGIISDQYLDACRQIGIPVDGAVSIGDTLPVSPEYFDSAYRSCYEISVKLAHILWRKFKPEDQEAADKNLIAVTEELITMEKYNLAIPLLDFAALTLKNYFNEDVRRTFIINRAQAYKWHKQENLCALILAKDDWVGQDDKFQLAVAVLSDNFALAARIMEKIGRSDAQDACYKESPLFREFRKSAEFQRTYERIFQKRFVKIEQVLKEA